MHEDDQDRHLAPSIEQQLLDALPYPNALITCAGELVRWNMAAANMFAALAPGLNLREGLAISAMGGQLELLQGHLIARKPSSPPDGMILSTRRGEDSALRRFDVHIEPWRGPGARDNILLLTGHEVTEYEELYEQMQDVVQESHISGEVLQQLPLGILLLDESWKVVYCLAESHETLGLNAESLTGKGVELFFEHESLERWRERLDLAPQITDETHFICPDGTRLEVEVSISALDSRFASWTMQVRDLTERRILEEELRQAQKVEALGMLTSGIAHDLNNLLTVMLGHLELAQDELDPDHLAHEDLEGIQAAVDRAAAMTIKLLAFARARVGEPQNIDLIDLINQIRPLLKQSLSEDILLEIGFDLPHANIIADTIQIEQLLINLVINARDAIGSNGGKIHIQISPRELTTPRASLDAPIPPDSYVVLSVIDTGEGMTPEVIEQIFTPFFTTKAEGKGTGLGLATCMRIIKQNRGFVRCESTPGEGTTFEIWLPAAEFVHVDISHSSDVMLEQTDSSVLLVEDDPALRLALERGLKRYGYKITIARNGSEAIKFLNRKPHYAPDLVITDVVMPGMGGAALAAHIHERFEGVPVLFISGYADEILLERGIDQGLVDFLAKPFSPSRLATHVQEVLARALPS